MPPAAPGFDDLRSSQQHSPANQHLATLDLVERARSGDPNALASLVERTYPRTLAAARSYLTRKLHGMRSKLDSADLTQSAYGDALRALPSFEAAGPGSFRRWLLGILRNKVRHRVRFFLSRRRDIGQEANERELQSLPSAATSPLAIAVLDEDKRRLRSAVEHLPPRQRAVVEARYFEELPWRDIALQLGTSEEAAQMLLARALAALRGALGSAAPSRSSR